MFKLTANPTFTIKCNFPVPGGKSEPVELEFKHLTKTGVKEFFANAVGKEDIESIGEILVGWKGFEKDYSQEALTQLLEQFPAAGADIIGFFSAELLTARKR
jgi:hypothetical protein